MARSNGQGHIYKRNGIYQLQYTIGTNSRGKPNRAMKSLKTSNYKEAKQRAAELLKELQNKDDLKTKEQILSKIADLNKISIPKNKLDLNNVWTEFKKYLDTKDISDGAKNRYKYRINCFVSWCSNITYLNDVTDEIAETYTQTLTGANKTYNDSVNALQKVFDVLAKKSGIIKNPFRKENIERKLKQSVKKKIFSEEELNRILNSFNVIKIDNNKQFELLFYIGAFTGARLKDCCLLKWTEIDFKNNFIKITPFKTKKHGNQSIIPILPELKEKLINAQEWETNYFVLPTIAETYNKNRKYVISQTNNILKLNGFKDQSNSSKGYTPCLYGFHSLRYYFVTMCARKGVHPALVKEAVGHSSPAMTEYYTILNNKDRQKSFGVLNQKQQLITQINKYMDLETVKEETLQEILDTLKFASGTVKKVVTRILE